MNCSSDLKNFANSWPSASNYNFFSPSLEQLFLTVGQNNFGNKIPFFSYNFQDGSWKFGLKDLGLSQSRVSKMNTFPLIGAQESEINLMEEEEEDNIAGNF